jgi:hypothetical protein
MPKMEANMTSTEYTQEALADAWKGLNAVVIRTRGSIPLRSPRPIRAGGHRPNLAAVLESVRRDIGGLPLNIVIHGWQDENGKRFIEDLKSLLTERDDVWLISSEADGDSNPEPGRFQVLNLRKGADRQLHDMILGDLVFFSARRFDVGLVTAQITRARVMIVQDQETFSEGIVRSAVKAQRKILRRGADGLMLEV